MLRRILIVDDEPDILETTRWAFEISGFETLTAASAEEAIDLVYHLRPQTVLIDYKLPKLSGLEVLRAAKQADPKSVAIMITGVASQAEWIESESKRLKADGFLQKPLPLKRIVQMVNEGWEKPLSG